MYGQATRFSPVDLAEALTCAGWQFRFLAVVLRIACLALKVRPLAVQQDRFAMLQ